MFPFPFAKVVDEININDVLMGRGGRVNNYKGNRQFRKIVNSYREFYLAAKSKSEKLIIARNVIDHIRSLQPPGRFLSEENGAWFEVKKEAALKKTSQALRENIKKLNASSLQSSSGVKLEKISKNCTLSSRPKSAIQNDGDMKKPSLPLLSGQNSSNKAKISGSRSCHLMAIDYQNEGGTRAINQKQTGQQPHAMKSSFDQQQVVGYDLNASLSASNYDQLSKQRGHQPQISHTGNFPFEFGADFRREYSDKFWNISPPNNHMVYGDWSVPRHHFAKAKHEERALGMRNDSFACNTSSLNNKILPIPLNQFSTLNLHSEDLLDLVPAPMASQKSNEADPSTK